MKYASIVIDNRSDNTDRLYTYGCGDLKVASGDKVYVPFSRSNSLREAYVVSVEDDAPDDVKKRLKYIEKVDKDVSLSSEMQDGFMDEKEVYMPIYRCYQLFYACRRKSKTSCCERSA